MIASFYINTNFPRNIANLTFQIICTNWRRYPTVSRHSHREYSAFTQHCLSKLILQLVNKVLRLYILKPIFSFNSLFSFVTLFIDSLDCSSSYIVNLVDCGLSSGFNDSVWLDAISIGISYHLKAKLRELLKILRKPSLLKMHPLLPVSRKNKKVLMPWCKLSSLIYQIRKI